MELVPRVEISLGAIGCLFSSTKVRISGRIVPVVNRDIDLQKYIQLQGICSRT